MARKNVINYILIAFAIMVGNVTNASQRFDDLFTKASREIWQIENAVKIANKRTLVNDTPDNLDNLERGRDEIRIMLTTLEEEANNDAEKKKDVEELIEDYRMSDIWITKWIRQRERASEE